MAVFLSFIIPTIGRPTITRAIESILASPGMAHGVEIVVVNDSGHPLLPAEWQNSEAVRLIATNRRERCYARNAGAAVARGSYLGFLDDDDWLLPNAITAYWELSQGDPEAVWLYGGVQVVDEHGTCLAEMNSGLNGDCFAQVMGGAWVPIQASCIRAEAFFKVGGYRTDILGTEDLDLCRRISSIGRLANTAEPVACLLRGETWNTSTNYLRAPEDTKRSRDAILDESGVFMHLIRTAGSSYWYGRILRVYLSTISWNICRKKYLRALSRSLYCLAFLALSGRHSATRQYWEGVRAQHVPGTLHFFMESIEHDRLNRKRNQRTPDT